ncbi:MAG: DUF1573 domain-containing protein [Opitutaceae bacterium]|nr:DUF1573 domain-containing protein [Opitutaceae bacterium]
MRPRRLWILPLLCAAAQPLLALDWEARTQTLAPAPFQLTQDVRFAFRNSGSRPVTILDLATNCDCLEAVSDRRTYAPGTAGVITARFTVGDRFGLYERFISVTTDEQAQPVRLTVRIQVPEVATLAPRTVTWQRGGPADERTVLIQVAEGIRIEFTETSVTTPTFTAHLVPREAGRSYVLAVKPAAGTVDAASAAIRVFGRAASGQPVVVSAYANVE